MMLGRCVRFIPCSRHMSCQSFDSLLILFFFFTFNNFSALTTPIHPFLANLLGLGVALLFNHTTLGHAVDMICRVEFAVRDIHSLFLFFLGLDSKAFARVCCIVTLYYLCLLACLLACSVFLSIPTGRGDLET